MNEAVFLQALLSVIREKKWDLDDVAHQFCKTQNVADPSKSHPTSEEIKVHKAQALGPCNQPRASRGPCPSQSEHDRTHKAGDQRLTQEFEATSWSRQTPRAFESYCTSPKNPQRPASAAQHKATFWNFADWTAKTTPTTKS